MFTIEISREVLHESFVFKSPTFTVWGKSPTRAMFSQVDVDFQLFFFRCWRLSFPLDSSSKGFKIVPFLSLVPRSSFGAGFGQKKLLPCQRNFFGFCTLVLANCRGMAASMLLRVAVARVVLWSFVSCCLQIALEWLRHCCSLLLLRTWFRDLFMVFCNLLLAGLIGMVAPKLRRWVVDDFSRFWHFPFSFSKASTSYFLWLLAPGSGFGAGFGPVSCEELRWGEMDELRRPDMRRAVKS